MNVQLRVLSGPFVGESILVDRPKFIVGREQDCQVRPDSEFVSRHHCVLLLDEFTLRVRDLGSKNGTFVNGRRITGEVVLCHDDMLSIGEMTMQIDLVAPVPAGAQNDAALRGTGFFDGNTLPSETPHEGVDSPIPLPVVPELTSTDPPASDTHHLPPPSDVDGSVDRS
jgi:predicted component of type VI protein secretion system